MKSPVVAGTAACAALLLLGGAAWAQGVPYGSPKERFIEALAGEDKVTITLQSPAAPGHFNSLSYELFETEVEEWSGGKIEVEVVFGSAIIRGNTAPAVKDGRLAYGSLVAGYDPSSFPISSALVDLAIIAEPSPFFGLLKGYGLMMEAGNATPEAWAEQRAYGIEPGLIVTGGVPTGLFCSKPLSSVEDFAGVQTRTAGVMPSLQVDGIGAVAVSLPYSEMFEGLQRGIIDCALTSLSTGQLAGIPPVAPYFVLSAQQSLALTSANWIFDAHLWEELPLAARQLLYDKQKVFLGGYIAGQLIGQKEALVQLAAAGGRVIEFDAGVTEKLAAVNRDLLENFGKDLPVENPAALVARFQAAGERWDTILSEMGYKAMDPGWAGFVDWYDPGKVDLAPYMDRLFEETMLPYRPQG